MVSKTPSGHYGTSNPPFNSPRHRRNGQGQACRSVIISRSGPRDDERPINAAPVTYASFVTYIRCRGRDSASAYRSAAVAALGRSVI